MKKPCIICVAITGSLPKKSDNPAVPITIEEQIDSTNAAFDAGIAKALDKPIITLHEDNLNHALKEINQSAVASCRSVSQVVQILTYVIKGEL